MSSHSYPAYLTKIPPLMAVIWAGFSFLIVYGLGVLTLDIFTSPTFRMNPFTGEQVSPLNGVDVLALLQLLVMSVGFWLLLAIVWIALLSLITTVEVHPDGLRVVTWVGKSTWLPWASIRLIRHPILAMGNRVLLTSPNLNWGYKLNGYSQFLVGGWVKRCFAIVSNISRYPELIQKIDQQTTPLKP